MAPVAFILSMALVAMIGGVVMVEGAVQGDADAFLSGALFLGSGSTAFVASVMGAI